MAAFTIVGIGEALFDSLPTGDVLGGAPLNVAVHAHQLAQHSPNGSPGRGVLVSRVGQDELGMAVINELQQRGLTTDYIQTDPDRPTGRVYVDLDAHGQATYDIVRHVAWDVLQYDPELEDLAQSCQAVCFGTLAQRDAQSRNTIYRFLDACPRAFRLFDVNLRGAEADRFYDARILRRSCEHASAIKLNEHELPLVVSMLGLRPPGASATDTGDTNAEALAAALLKAFRLEMIVLTRGARGTCLYTTAGCLVGAPVSYPAAEGADSVGAGDACAAGVLVGRVLRLPPPRIVELANHLGAFVASQPGATPELPEAIFNLLKR